MKKVDSKIVIAVIKQEIRWCKNQGKLTSIRKSFILGLRQAIFIINQIKRGQNEKG